MEVGRLDLRIMSKRVEDIMQGTVQEDYGYNELLMHDEYVERVLIWARALCRINDPGVCPYEAQDLVELAYNARQIISNEIYHAQMVSASKTGGKL